MGNYTLAITGASGMPYARRTLQLLLDGGHTVHCAASSSGMRVLDIEEGLALKGEPQEDAERLRKWAGATGGELLVHHRGNVAAPIASGSFRIDGMAVAPCSGGTLGRIANGVGGGLIERAAEVCLKERTRLVLVPRETPLSRVYIQNMLKATDAGAVVLPASPGFYHRPESIADLVDMVAGRIVALLGLDSDALKPWTGRE